MSPENQFIFSYKNSFSAGELTPLMDGRTDLAIYQHGVKNMINFVCLPSGGVIRRPGTKFRVLASSSEVMLPFIITRKISYLVLFSIFDNKTIVSVVLADEVITIATLNFNFKVSDFNYTIHQGIYYISFGVNHPVFTLTKNMEKEYETKEEVALLYPEEKAKFFIFRKLELKNSFVYIDKSDSQAQELLDMKELEKEHKQTLEKNLKDYNSHYEQVRKKYLDGSLTLTPKQYDEKIKADLNKYTSKKTDLENAYDKKNKLHKKTVAAYRGVRTFDDVHQVFSTSPDEKIQISHLYAKILIVFNRRLWSLGAFNKPYTILSSYVNRFNEFDLAPSTLLEVRNPLSAINATFLSGSLDSILWAITFIKELVIATTEGIYILSEGDRAKGEFINIHKDIDMSISGIKPVKINKTIFFVGGDERQIYSFYYSREKGGFQIKSVNVFAEHLFVGGIKKIVGVSSPFNMLVAILKNGSFVTLVYDHDLQLVGWSQHWIGGNGRIEDAVILPKKKGDEIYFIVKRNNGKQKVHCCIESLDCSNMTANYSLNEVMYIDSYHHVYRDSLNLNILKELAKLEIIEFIHNDEMEVKKCDENFNKLLNTLNFNDFAFIGFKYTSYVETFPFIFADEFEYLPKQTILVGLKIFNTKGGYIKMVDHNGCIKKYEIAAFIKTVSATPKEKVENWNKLTLEDKVDVLGNMTLEEKVENWIEDKVEVLGNTIPKELAEHWNRLTLEDKVELLASTRPKGKVENWNKLILEDKVEFLASTRPKERTENWNRLTLEDKVDVLANIPQLSHTGWIDCYVDNKIDKDIKIIFGVDNHYPVTLLKTYVKVKLLYNYK